MSSEAEALKAWLTEAYKEDKPAMQREIAEREAKLWLEHKLASSSPRAIGGRERFGLYFQRLGTTQGKSEHRAFIFNTGEASQDLWQDIATERISLGTAMRICRAGRNLFKRSKCRGPNAPSLRQCIGIALGEHYQGRLGELQKAPQNKSASETLFHETVLRAATDYLKSELQGFEEWEFDELLSQFTGEVKALSISFVNRVRVRNQSRRTVSKTSLKAACEQLGMLPPTKHRPLDYELAKRKHRKLLAQHHPDVNKSEQSIAIYNEVNKAMEVIEEWKLQSKEGQA